MDALVLMDVFFILLFEYMRNVVID